MVVFFKWNDKSSILQKYIGWSIILTLKSGDFSWWYFHGLC